MKYHLVTNPGSRHRRGRRLADTYARLLEARGAEFEAAATTTLDDAERLTRDAIAAGAEVVVAVGGDGTINRVLRGFFDGNGRAAAAAMGVLYAGTSPDFCRFHGIPTEPAAAVETLLRGRVVPVDVARVIGRDAAGEERIAYFASSANLGLGAGIARRANRLRPWLGDFLGTLAATLVTVVSTPPAAVRLTVDGREENGEKVLNVTIGKNPHLASGLKLGVDADPADGRLYCFVIHGVSRLSLLRRLPSFYTGAATDRPPFLLRRDVRETSVSARDGRLEYECDGDPEGYGPVTVTVLPRALSLIGGQP